MSKLNGNIAFIFPGQGAQAAGMGKDFYETKEASRKIFDQASHTLGMDMAELCFEKNDKLDITEYTQAALLTTEIAMLEAVKEAGIEAAAHAGLSLGEYSALVASGVMEFKDAAAVVRQRGILMQEAVPVGQGTMVAVIGLPVPDIEKICQKVDGIVEIANYNSPGQTVISGEKKAVMAAKERAEEAKARMAVELKVSGPFHSSLLKPAGERLAGVLEPISISPVQIPYLANLTADYVPEAGQVKDLLVKQVYSSVRWFQTVERMIADGIDTFIEIGPGKTLAGFNKKINKEVKTINIASVEDLKKLEQV